MFTKTLIRNTGACLVLLACVICSLCLTINADPIDKEDWKLSWSDEFTEGQIDASKWSFDIGGSGWGNHELQSYTNRRENALVENGVLDLAVIKEDFVGPDKILRHYTSARLLTKNKFSQTYGRFEARLQLPYGQGIWPAFWMLGNDIDSVHWPGCGEIDIMENIGKEPSIVHGTIHGPGYSGAAGVTGKYLLPNSQRFSDAYHTFAFEWEPRAMRFYVDKRLYQTLTQADLPAGKQWVFDHPFFLILNVAIGGDFPGSPDGTTIFPQHMKVDYVRVYTRNPPGPQNH